jgi:L-gulonate 5-dehydrogenase
MKAAVLVDDQRFEIRNVPKPVPGADQVLIRVRWASICGTDMHIYLGEFKDRVKYPRILCHEFSGDVAAVGPKVTAFKPGDRVVADPIIWCGSCPACLDGRLNICCRLQLIGIDYDGGFAEFVSVGMDKVFKVPEGIALRTAALTELYALGVHSVRRARIEPGDKVVVLGAGRLGLSVLEVARLSATTWVAVVDVIDSRLEIARQMGADLVINALKEDPVRAVLGVTNNLGVDRVIETIGAAVTIPERDWPAQQAVKMSRHGGRMVMMGLGPQETPVLWKEVALKELEIAGSRVTLGDFPRALDLMASNRFHPDLLITRDFQIEETGEAFRLLEEDPGKYIKVLIRMD